MRYEHVLDLHTHTIVSGHAYCTLKEMAETAAEKGLALLGVTEHAPRMPGTCHNFYFHNLKNVPREICGIRVLLGAEVNILDWDGTVDLNEREIRNMDVVIASLHLPCIQPGTREENTRACIRALENPYVNILGHPDDGRFELDYRAVVQAAGEHGKVLELNNHSLKPTSFRKNARENDMRILELCREYRVPVLMGSDAHYDAYIGEFSNARQVLMDADFPEELVLNRSVEAVAPYVNRMP